MFRLAPVAGALVALAVFVSAQNSSEPPKAIAGSPQSTTTPESKPPSFKASTHVVTVNVVVTDQQGNPIRGLTKEDFELLDNGKPQPIRFFEPITDEAPPVAQKRQPNTYTNIPQLLGAPRNVTAIVYDTRNSGWIAQSYGLHRLRAFLRRLRPEDHVALYVMGDGLRMLHDFDRDASELVQAIQRYDEQQKLPKSQRPKLQTRGVSPLDDLLNGREVRLRLENEADAYAPSGGTAAEQAEARVMTITSLEGIARRLAAAPGRKSLVWISDRLQPLLADRNEIEWELKQASQPLVEHRGFAGVMLGEHGLNGLNPYQLRAAAGEDLVPLLVRLFNDNDIAVYPVSSEGLQAVSFNLDPASSTDLWLMAATGRGPTNDASGVMSVAGPAAIQPVIDELEAAGNVHAHQDMYEVARRTGGRAFYNRNDLETGMSRALEDGRYTYELAYYPDHGKWNGEWRKISVKVTKADICEPPGGLKRLLVGGCLHLLARGGYFALPEPKPVLPQGRKEFLAHVATTAAEFTQLPISVHIEPASAGELDARVWMDAQRLLTSSDAEHWQGNFELLFFMLVPNKGPAQRTARNVTCCTLQQRPKAGDPGGPLLVPTKSFQFTIDRAAYDLVIKRGIEAKQRLQLPAGATMLTIVLHEKTTNAIGSVRVPLEQYTTAVPLRE